MVIATQNPIESEVFMNEAMQKSENTRGQNVPAMKKNEESYIQMSFLDEVANA